MKADQLNRFMRTNGRKNLWLLRNTNTIYEQAIKSYYQRSNSLLPYNPTTQHHKKREENQAPIRTLTSQQERIAVPEYPRNHQQMTDKTTAANSGNLLNTVMQANRRRSMSFTGTSNLHDYIYPSNEPSSATLRSSRSRTRPGSGLDVVEQLDLGILSGRSISLPPRSARVDLAVRKAKEPPCHRHHINAIAKSTTAAVAAVTRSKQRNDYSQVDSQAQDEADDDQLMKVDEALKQRLAVRFDREQQAESASSAGRCFGAAAGRGMLSKATTTTLCRPAAKEQTRFQTLAERIRQFECIQFADGPVTYQAFNRRQGFGSGRGSLMGSKHLPKQQPCLSFRNVLHTNHRQRCMQNSQTRSQSVSSSSLPMPPIKARSRTKAAFKSMPQQQLQQQLSPSPMLAKPSSKVKRSKSRRFNSNRNSSNSSQCSNTNSNSSNGFAINNSSRQAKLKAKAKEQQQSTTTTATGTTAAAAAAVAGRGNSNHLSRSSHLPYIKHCGNKLEVLSDPPTSMPATKQAPQRKMLEQLPKQPLIAKGANHLLAASASQVAACRRAFKNHQQILQAELLHNYAQDQVQPVPTTTSTPTTFTSQAQAKMEAKVASSKPLVEQTMQKVKTPKKVVRSTETSTSMSTPHVTSSVTTLPELATETSFMAIDAKPKWSPALQQQQLHQQLRQRRQQPYDNLWRYNY